MTWKGRVRGIGGNARVTWKGREMGIRVVLG